MSYAIRNDGLGWRAVNGPDDVGSDEAYSETQPPVVNAPGAKTVFSALDYLGKFTDAEYQAARTGTIRAQRALDMLIAAQFVDIVNDQRVPAALDIMIADCDMTIERKAELLAPDPA